MFNFCFFTGTESRYELQLYAPFINQNTKRTTSFELILIMRGQTGHGNPSFSKIPKPFGNMSHRILLRSKGLRQVSLLPCSCGLFVVKNPLEEPQDQEVLVRAWRHDIIPSVPSRAHVASVPLPIHLILFFFFFFFFTLATPSVFSYLYWLISLAYSPLWS